MMKLKKIFSFFILLSICICIFSACSTNKIYVSWVDADGILLGRSEESKSFDPSDRPLPDDSDEWQYTGWLFEQKDNNILCTAQRIQKVKVCWYSAENELLDTQFMIPSDISSQLSALPEDSDEWHYTGWKESQSDNVYTFHAERVHQSKYIWKNTDGSILEEKFILDGEKIPDFNLPESSDKWIYTQWEKQEMGNETVYIPNRVPNPSYFRGNVFQIIYKDASGEKFGAGSGCVINDDGWFITNNHVMKDGYTATGFFDIKDTEKGTLYTEIPVIGGSYYDSKYDIFIGKLENYEKIKSYYHVIDFTETYEKGKPVYTVGYPDASINMEIHSGILRGEYVDIFNKVDGLYYLVSDAYMGLGSSGGILTDENLNILGITTIVIYLKPEKTYKECFSVPTSLFLPALSETNVESLQSLPDIYHSK